MKDLITRLGAVGFVLLAGCTQTSLKAVRAAPARVESTVTTTSAGTVRAEQQAVLAFGSGGRVTRVSVEAGDRVRREEILAELENDDLRTVFRDAARELKRSQKLFASGLVSRADLDEAGKAFEIAKTNFDKSLIQAPFDGIVTEVNLEMGELAQAGAVSEANPPIRIVDTLPRLIRGDIDEVDLSKVKVGTPARVKIQATGGGWFPAQVTKVVPFVSTVKEQDRTSQIELRMGEIITGGAERIPVGASADIELITEAKDRTLAVPARVALGHGQSRYVFRFEEGRIRKTPIRIGIGNYGRVEILSGLSQGDVVVFPPEEAELKDGMKAKVEIQPWP